MATRGTGTRKNGFAFGANVEEEARKNLFGEIIEEPKGPMLQERFLVPPFSVLDARQGYWQDRKREWTAIGISSADGRGDVLWDSDIKDRDYYRRKNGARPPKMASTTVCATDWMKQGPDEGGSIFDPVLCELSYRWFCPLEGKILDPFAGGSVRGIVAEKLGYKYTGIELRPEQVAANEEQAKAIGCSPNWIIGDSSKMNKVLPLHANEVTAYDEKFDMVFTCPPYYDLEQYSESNDDGSCKQTYEEFLEWYGGIFKLCLARLKWNRFFVVVVGEIRDEKGFYRNFVGDTVSVLLRLGLRYYNEAVLVTSVGSLPLRVNTQFGSYRKLGKTHQNMLVFYYGNNCEQLGEKFAKIL